MNTKTANPTPETIELEAHAIYKNIGLTPRQLADELKFSQGHCDRLIADRNDQVEHHNRMVDERNEARAENARLRNQRAELIAAIERVIVSDDAHATLHAADGDDVSRMIEFAAAHDNLRTALARAKAVPK